MSELGLEEIRGNAKQKIMNSECDGILLSKKQNTDMRFPRSIKAIRRVGVSFVENGDKDKFFCRLNRLCMRHKTDASYNNFSGLDILFIN